MQQQDSTTSRSIAVDSKKLAEASTRDSSSMKAIAVLTMVFLPSTAIAVGNTAYIFVISCLFKLKTLQTIFSMGPFFNNGSLSVSSDFWIYWVVSIATTVVVLFIWQVWLRRERQRRVQREDDIEELAAGKSKTI